MDTLQNELDADFSDLNIQIIGVNERGHETGNNSITSDRDLPWLQDLDSDDDGASDVFLNSWDFVYRDVVIVDANNEVVTTYNLTDNNLGETDNYNELRDLFVSAATVDSTNPWRNSAEPLDVNNDTFISPLDALLILNELNSVGAHELGTPTGPVDVYFDTSDNGFVDPLDALLVLNHLNAVNSVSGEREGEGENALAALPLPSQLEPTESSVDESNDLKPHFVDDVFVDPQTSQALEFEFEIEEKEARVTDSSVSQSESDSLDVAPIDTF